MTTLADIKDQIFRNTNGIYQDQHQMKLLINNSLSDLANEAKMQKVQFYSITPGTASYDLPDTYKSPICLIEGTIDNPFYTYKLVDITSPEYGYAIYDGQIWLKPTPSAIKTVNLYYYAYHPELVNDTDEFQFDNRYANIVAAYASAMILALPGMPDTNKWLVERYFSMWNEGKAGFKEDMQKKVKQVSVKKVNIW